MTAEATPNGAKILVVDDQAAVREVTCVGLELQGYDVVSAAGRDEAIEAYDQAGGAISLLVLDLQLENGPAESEEIFEALRARRANLPVLLVSGGLEENALGVYQAHGGGPATFLAKPYTPAQLATQVRALLGE